MDFKKLITRFRQFGGMRLVIEYAKLGALLPAVKAGVRCLVKRLSFKGIYPEVLRKVEPFLVERYGTQIPQIARIIKANTDYINDNHNLHNNANHEHPKVIWWCWLQGLDAAPAIVKACYNSLKQLTGYLVVIDNKNWREYLELPEYIVRKWEKGRIPVALFSDLLRLELLIKYGGTWIDSTVLCTAVSSSKFQVSSFLEADLFLFQYTKEGSVPLSISNWFITACRNNEVLMVLREMLYAYWKDYDCALDYYFFHLFFAMISKEYPEQMAAMPHAQSQNSLVLLHHWGERFDQRKWDKLTSQVCFHKLSHRVEDSVKSDKDNYYNAIIKMYGQKQIPNR